MTNPPRNWPSSKNWRGVCMPSPAWPHLALSDSMPLSGTPRSTIYSVIDVAGRPPAAEGTGGMVTWRAVTPGYFAALGVPILRGRGFREEDRDPHQNAIILSDSLARRMFPGEDPAGQADPSRPVSLRPLADGGWRGRQREEQRPDGERRSRILRRAQPFAGASSAAPRRLS